MKTITKIAAAGLFSVGLIGLAGCATPADKEPELVVDGEEWECRTSREIGKLIPKKECASPQTWAERDEAEKLAAADTSRRIRERGGGASRGGGIGN